ncbi:hypothetical protein [Streptomyces gobitricini]|uniref:hypothetical protein n=1 Tax=Streptomyces gobitricini TaxID=68211 RepID=UPI0031D2F173
MGSAAAAEQATELARLLVVLRLRFRWCGGLEAGGFGGCFLAAMSSAWQVPHIDRSPAFQAVLAVVSSQRWSVNFCPHRLHTGRRDSRSAARRRSSSASARAYWRR